MRRALLLPLLLAVGCGLVDPALPDSDQDRIRALLRAQQEAWNRGSLEDFLEGYAAGDAVRFVGADGVVRGLAEVRRRYRTRYASPEQMGRLTFGHVEIRLLDPRVTVCTGSWELERAGDRPHGWFSLVLVRNGGRWHIVHDHTSSAGSSDS